MTENIAMDRRQLLRAGMLTLGLLSLPVKLTAQFSPRYDKNEKSLLLYNQHTDETLYTVYWYKGAYLNDSLREVESLFRDHRANLSHAIDPNLLDSLYDINQLTGNKKAIEIVSAYRSPQTNKALRKRSRKVAKNSYHMKGQAVDITLPSRSLGHAYKAALSLKAGGVGYYPGSGFIHIDTGPVRKWR